MENRDQTSSSSSSENRSSPFPATHSPLNHHPSFEKPLLNPPNTETLFLSGYLNGLSLSQPRHHPWDPHGSVLSRRVLSAVKGQNRNFHASDYCNQDVLSGRPESDYNRVSGLFGPNGLTGSTNPSVRLGKNSNLYDDLSRHYHFSYDNMINNRENGSFLLPIMDSFGSTSDKNSLFGPFYSRPNSVQNGPTYSQNGFLDQPKTMYDKSLDPNGLFGSDSVCVPNGLSKSLLSSRPNVGLNRPISPKTWGDKSGPIHSGKAGSSSSWPGEDYSKYRVKEFKGNIKKMAKNRECSGFLKKKIEDGAEEDLELIFDEVKDDSASLMVNYFGSIVIQKLFKVCRPEQISHILFSVTRIKFEFVEICCDNHGSAAMGKLLENLTTRDQQAWFTSALRSVVLILCKDQNGLKVVKYCIDHFSENADVLINEIARDCLEIAMHKSGCCIFEPCLLRADGETMKRFMDQLGPNAAILSVHQYGNYVVQSLLDKKNPSITKNIIAQLAGNYVYISMDRCGSNVIEKCLIVASENEAIKIIIEIMNSDKFAMVLTDPYGNYVVQKALEVSQKMRWKEIQENLENCIMQLYASLHNHPYGNRVLSKIKSFPKRF